MTVLLLQTVTTIQEEFIKYLLSVLNSENSFNRKVQNNFQTAEIYLKILSSMKLLSSQLIFHKFLTYLFLSNNQESKEMQVCSMKYFLKHSL